MKYVVRYDRLVEGHEEQHLYRQMSEDPTTTSDELRALFNKYSEIDVSIAEHKNCPEDVLTAIYEKHKHGGMQRIRIFSIILSHPNLTYELATKMLDDHSEKEIDLGSAIHDLGACTKLTKDQLFEVLALNVDTTRAVFRNPSLGDDGIREILASGQVSVYQLLLNPAMSTKTILDALSDNIEGYERDEDDTKFLKEELAKRGDVLDELLEAKEWDDETSAAEYAFKNRLTSAAELTIFIDLMLARGERSLLIDAAMHSNTSLEDLRKLAKYSDDTAFYAAFNKNIDDDLAREIWDANDENTQENLMMNPSCPTDVLIKGMSSPFDFVEKAAKEAMEDRDVLGDLLGENTNYKMKNKHIASYLDHQINEMAIIDREKMPRQDKIEIDLSGPEGNAFNLLALAKRLYSQLHKEEIDVWKRTNELMKAQGKPALPSPMDILLQEMMESDYDNLINIFDREFGDFVTLYR